MKIVSACLAGINCRHDGKSKPCEKVMEMVAKGEAIPVCPEQLGGLTTPRAQSEIRGGKVLTINGQDISAQCRKGAEEGLKIAILANCKEAILKANSPSCGVGKVYDGTFSGKLVDGDGTFSSILKKNGIKVKTEKEI